MMIIKVIYIFGPIALALSLVPMFKDNMNMWLSGFIGTSCVLVTQNVLLNLQVLYLSASAQGIMTGASNGILSTNMSTVFNVVIIALHISVFWLTKQWISGGGAGAVFSNAINAASMVAGVKMAGMVAGKGAATGGNVDNAADAFKNKS